jgi:hypothetical protein
VNDFTQYEINYKNGTVPIGDLPIGARVTDTSWEWEFRKGKDYTRIEGDVTKSVLWIVVAKDHYSGLGPHVTLLSKELIGKFPFDNSTNRNHSGAKYGCNHWGDSGSGNATRGLRPWLNSNGIHASEGFYRAFSVSFKEAVLETALPNEEWKNGMAYSTQDKVFIPSTTELGDNEHKWTKPTNYVYPYLQEAGDAKRVARSGGEAWFYWTRSPASYSGNFVRSVTEVGDFDAGLAYHFYREVRPALNLKSEILVSKTRGGRF